MISAPTTKQFNIAGIGEVLWDIYENQKYIGGSPANFAIHIAQAGHHAYLFSRIGEDENGRELEKKLAAKNINTSGIQHDFFKKTGSVRITIDESGSPTYECSQNAAFDDMRIDSNWEELAVTMDAVFFGLLAQRAGTSKEAIQTFLKKAEKALKICDLNIRRWDAAVEQIVQDSLQLADVIKLNKNEIDLLKKGFGAETDDRVFLKKIVQEHNLKLAALTLGPHGCYLVTPDAEEFDPGYFIRAVDTSGAGDAFVAGLAIKYLEGAPLTEIADLANLLAAYVSIHQGATPAWTFDQLKDFKSKSL